MYCCVVMGKSSLPTHRARLATVLRAAKEVVSVDLASEALGTERRQAAKLLSRWKQQGWLRRIGRGLLRSRPTGLGR
jgi:predicted transcriptional regulator of viral defense system